MARRNRIRRRLTLNVSERLPNNPNETWTPGARFATGWQHFCNTMIGPEGIQACGGDPIMLAGYLAAKAAWDAHFHATNWMDLAQSDGPIAA